MAHTEPTLLRLVRLARTLLSTKTRQSLAVVVFALLLRSAWAKRTASRRLLRTLEDQLEEEYDVIVVGGGTAGCVIASRLSEDPSTRVLLLEAGQSSKTVLLSRVPSGYPFIYHTQHDYNLYTVPQASAKKRQWFWPRAKLLGGCSAINAMMYHYGAPTDYDEWAQIAHDDSWAYKDFIRYFRKFEKYSPSSKYPLVDAAHRSSQGLVSVGYESHTGPLTKAFIDSCHTVGIPTSPDVNTPSGTLGSTRIMTYINSKGERVTTESAYLTPDVLRRPNLTVVVGARATKLILTATPGGKPPRVVGVEFAGSKFGKRLTARAKKEVVLSAGAVHTPQLLMLSGIGPAEHLSAHGIHVWNDLPGVGSGLKDHACINVNFREKAGGSLSYLQPSSLWDNVKLQAATLRWLVTGGGPLSSNFSEGAAFARTTNDSLFEGEGVESLVPRDTSSGPQAPDIELIFTAVGFKDHGHGPVPSGNLVSIITVLLRPESEGTIRLASADVFDAPVIDPQYLSAENDVTTLVRGLRLALKVARTPPFGALLDSTETSEELDHFLHYQSNEGLAEAVRERTETIYHPCRTARMAPREEGGVVDGRLRVYGVQGLRVADASIFPEIVAGHTAAPCIAIGEKCADMMKEEIAFRR